MSHKIVEVHTWECDIPKCPETITAYGERYAEENGWVYAELFNRDMNLCPDHYKEIQRFLFDEN